MRGEYFGILTAICWAIGIFPFTLSTKYFAATHINLMRLILALILLSPFIILNEAISLNYLFALPGAQNWIWLGLSGVIGLALGDYFSFSAFKAIGARNSSIFNTLAPGTAIIFGYFMLGEKINLIGLVGIFITLGGIIFISLQKRDDHSKMSLIGIGHAIGAALCQGAGLVLAKKAYENNDIHIAPFHAAWLRIVGAVAVLIVLTIFTRQIKPLLRNSINPENKKGIIYLFFGTLSGTVLGLSFAMQTISMIDSAVAQTIFSLVPVIAIPLAYLLHKEKITIAIIIGAFIAIIGVIILIWRNTIMEKLILNFL
jgi:drug/metabolite transporter (DMT)-like permease